MPSKKITTSISDANFKVLVKAYLNGEISNNHWSLMTPALRKKIKRAAKHYDPLKADAPVEEVNNAS